MALLSRERNAERQSETGVDRNHRRIAAVSCVVAGSLLGGRVLMAVDWVQSLLILVANLGLVALHRVSWGAFSYQGRLCLNWGSH